MDFDSNFDFSSQIISMGIMQLNLYTLHAMTPFIMLEGKKVGKQKIVTQGHNIEMAISQ